MGEVSMTEMADEALTAAAVETIACPRRTDDHRRIQKSS